MANQLTRTYSRVPVGPRTKRQTRQEIARQMQRMAEIGDLTKTVMDEIAETTRFSACEATRAVQHCDLQVQKARARGLSDSQYARYVELRAEYLKAVLQCVQMADAALIALLQKMVREPPERYSVKRNDRLLEANKAKRR